MPSPAIVMYCTQTCPYCDQAERLLTKRGISTIQKIRVDLDPTQRDVMIEKTKRRTVPQIFIGETHVGGFAELEKLEHDGKLSPLLAG